jgi:hypothetical protein
LILYFDTSSIVAILLAEASRHHLLRTLIEEADFVATARISYAEARAALDIARREPTRRPRLLNEAYVAAVSALDRDWRSYIRVNVSERLVRSAGQLAAEQHLKGYDAVQLASALELSERIGSEVRFSTWDLALSRAAQAEGLELAHEVPA